MVPDIIFYTNNGTRELFSIFMFLFLVLTHFMFPLVAQNKVAMTNFLEYDKNMALCQVHVNAYLEEKPKSKYNIYIKYSNTGDYNMELLL